MTARALSLHEEIVDAMYEHNVDPMERGTHNRDKGVSNDMSREGDKMMTTAITKLQNAPAVPSYRSTNLDFWKGFNVNQKYLQAKSAADVRKQTNKKANQKKNSHNGTNHSPVRTKTQTHSQTRQQPMQDQRMPARNLACLLPPPSTVVPGEELTYGVSELMAFVHPTLEKKTKKKKKLKQAEMSAKSPTRPGTHGVTEGGEKAIESRKRLGSSELLLAPSLPSLHQESFATAPSFDPEQNSFVSGTGSVTVVPSLNLSGVVASQVSGRIVKEAKGSDEGGGADKNGAGSGRDAGDQTADDPFADDNDNTNSGQSVPNPLETQPSFSFTDGGEDFLFAQSMMDGTLATATTALDDQTNPTMTTSVHAPVREGGGRRRKGQWEKTRGQKKVLLSAVKGGYGDIGSAVPGGLVAQGPSRERPVKELEQRSGAGREPRGGSFPGAVRFPPSVPSSGQGAGEGVAVTAQGQGQVVRKGVFSATERFSDVTSALVTPAPGDYRIKRLFEGGRDRQVSAERCEELMEAIEGKRALRNQNCNFMANQAVFGFGCSVQEHVQYGLCLDGMCGRRAKWEDVTLLTQDRDRLGHGGEVGRRTVGGTLHSTGPPEGTLSNTTGDSRSLGMSQRTLNSIHDLRKSLKSAETPDFSPLKTASLRGDFSTVVQLCLLGSDINERDRDLETILHQAVKRNYLHMIVCLTEVPGHAECLNDELKDLCRNKSRGMFTGVIELDAQDCDGNTPLHIAAVRGNALMAEVLCDAGVTPDGIKNNVGKTASDVAKTQRLFQIIKMAQGEHVAREELKSLRERRREVRGRSRQSRRRGGGEEVEKEESDDCDEEEEGGQEEEAVSGAEGETLLPPSRRPGHSLHVGYFGSPQQLPKQPSEREKYARFLNMRR